MGCLASKSSLKSQQSGRDEFDEIAGRCKCKKFNEENIYAGKLSRKEKKFEDARKGGVAHQFIEAFYKCKGCNEFDYCTVEYNHRGAVYRKGRYVNSKCLEEITKLNHKDGPKDDGWKLSELFAKQVDEETNSAFCIKEGQVQRINQNKCQNKSQKGQ